jgi:hypothetical protein
MKNKYGLSRTVPPDIKYRIRKDDHFGCIHCGLAIGIYEHIDPEFAEAKEHNPEKMAFLCDSQNQRKERGYLSKETIWKWKNDPWCKKYGHCHDSVDIGSDNFSIWLGGDKIERIEKIISIGDDCILSIKPPEESGAPYRLSAVFHDNQNKKILEIVDNEWKAESDSFDIVCSSGKIGIRKDGSFVLKIIVFPPKEIVIDTINMLFNGFRFIGDSNSLEIIKPNGVKVKTGGRLHKAISNDSSFLYFPVDGNYTVLGGGTSMSPLMEKIPMKPITTVKINRNADCPCESGKKYKNCCYPKYDYML